MLRALRDLGPRAQRAAQKAVPATGQTVSLCMIVKDEEAMLPRALAAVAEFVDELIVVDTGSTDRTVEIAESFGAQVLHHEWDGDFAAARNVGLDAATSDWLMYLDADEVLVDGDGPRLRELLGHTWREGIFLTETNHVGELEDGAAVQHNALRLFRNRPEYRFEGRVHEQFAHKLPTLPERIAYTQVRIEHFGYLGAVRDAKEKSRRNLELLERQIAEGVDTPFLHFNLGSERAAAGDVAGSLAHLARAWEKLADDPERLEYGYFPSLCARLVKALNANGRHREAIAQADQILAELEGFTDLVLEQAHGLPRPRRPGRGDRALRALHRDGRCPVALQRHRRRRHLPRPQPAGRDLHRRRPPGRRRGPAPARPGALPGLHRRRRALRPRAAAQRRAGRRGRGARRRARARAHARPALPAGGSLL